MVSVDCGPSRRAQSPHCRYHTLAQLPFKLAAAVKKSLRVREIVCRQHSWQTGLNLIELGSHASGTLRVANFKQPGDRPQMFTKTLGR
jgi:hypothetical protein